MTSLDRMRQTDQAEQKRASETQRMADLDTMREADQAAMLDGVVDRIIGVESAGVATAKNPLRRQRGWPVSESTWVRTIAKHRPDLAQKLTRAEVLALRTDPALSRQIRRPMRRTISRHFRRTASPSPPRASTRRISLVRRARECLQGRPLHADGGCPWRPRCQRQSVDHEGANHRSVLGYVDRQMKGQKSTAPPTPSNASRRRISSRTVRWTPASGPGHDAD